MVASVPSIPEVSGAVLVAGTTTAHITWVSQNIPKIRWAIFNGGKNISGPLKVTNYTLKGLKNHTSYSMLICSSTDGKNWTKGRPIQFRTKKDRTTNQGSITSTYTSPTLPAEVTNVGVNTGASSVTLNWTKSPSTTHVKITDGCGYASPPLTGSSYTINYADLHGITLYIMSSSNGVDYTFGIEVRSVIPDVDPSTVVCTLIEVLAGTQMDLNVKYFKPLNLPQFDYSIADDKGLTYPTSKNDELILKAMRYLSTGDLQPDGSYTYESVTSSGLTFYGYSKNTTEHSTYGTTIYVYTSPVPEVSDLSIVPRSDVSGVDVTFTGHGSSYLLVDPYKGTQTSISPPTVFIPYPDDFNVYTYSIYTNPTYRTVNGTSVFNDVGGIHFTIPFPKVKNFTVSPGPTSVTITWTPEKFLFTKYLSSYQGVWFIAAGNNPLRVVNEPSVTLNYSDLTPNSMVWIYTSISMVETRVFFYPGSTTVSGYTMGSNNNLMILVLLVILFLLLKKK